MAWADLTGERQLRQTGQSRPCSASQAAEVQVIAALKVLEPNEMAQVKLSQLLKQEASKQNKPAEKNSSTALVVVLNIPEACKEYNSSISPPPSFSTTWISSKNSHRRVETVWRILKDPQNSIGGAKDCLTLSQKRFGWHMVLQWLL